MVSAHYVPISHDSNVSRLFVVGRCDVLVVVLPIAVASLH